MASGPNRPPHPGGAPRFGAPIFAQPPGSHPQPPQSNVPPQQPQPPQSHNPAAPAYPPSGMPYPRPTPSQPPPGHPAMPTGSRLPAGPFTNPLAGQSAPRPTGPPQLGGPPVSNGPVEPPPGVIRPRGPPPVSAFPSHPAGLPNPLAPPSTGRPLGPPSLQPQSFPPTMNPSVRPAQPPIGPPQTLASSGPPVPGVPTPGGPPPNRSAAPPPGPPGAPGFRGPPPLFTPTPPVPGQQVTTPPPFSQVLPPPHQGSIPPQGSISLQGPIPPQGSIPPPAHPSQPPRFVPPSAPPFGAPPPPPPTSLSSYAPHGSAPPPPHHQGAAAPAVTAPPLMRPPPSAPFQPSLAMPPAHSSTPSLASYPSAPPPPSAAMPPPPSPADSALAQQLAEDMRSLTIGLPAAGGSMDSCVDSSSLPRPAGVRLGGGGGEGVDETLWGEGIVGGGLAEIEGNAHPAFFRLTCGAIPESQSLKSRWHLPLGAVVQPLAPTPAGQPEVPVVNFGPSGIVRCRRCRSYVNPFATFTDGGRRWRCNFCGMLNEVSHEYFCALDASGERLDKQHRPELMGGSVEYVAPVEYMVRPPMPPALFFLLDVSVINAHSGVYQVLADAIRNCLDSLPGDTRARVGFMAFDSSLYFISLKPSLSQPQMLVTADLDDPFLPLPDDELLVNAHESRHVILALLDALPTLFASHSSVESALGPALKAMSLVMSQLGGKVLLFQSAMPSLGVGRLRLRGDVPSIYNTDREHTLRIAEEPFYKTTAAEFSRSQICVDVFSFASRYCDLASIGTLARYTGGQLYHFPAFKLANDGERLRRTLVRNLTRETAWESVIRIRCSKGLKISTFHGHFFIRSSDLLALPAADADKGYAVQISHDEAVLANQSMAYAQCALLYTSSGGERRIRVHTLAVPIVRDLREMYRRVDVGATVTLLGKIALDKLLSARLEDARQLINQRITAALKEYRAIASPGLGAQHNYPSAPPSGAYSQSALPHHHQQQQQQQLLFPASLELLPLYGLALCKCPAIRGGFHEMGADARSAAMFSMMTMPVGRTLRLLYPRLMRVDDLAPTLPYGQIGANGMVTLPPCLPLTTKSLDPRGAYLLDDSVGIMLWLGGNLSPAAAHQLVGPEAGNSPDISQMPFNPPSDDDLARRLATIVEFLQGGCRAEGQLVEEEGPQPVQLLRQGGQREQSFYVACLEDRSSTGLSYPEFVVQLYRQVLHK